MLLRPWYGYIPSREDDQCAGQIMVLLGRFFRGAASFLAAFCLRWGHIALAEAIQERLLGRAKLKAEIFFGKGLQLHLEDAARVAVGFCQSAVGPQTAFLIHAKDMVTLPLAPSRVRSELAACLFYVFDLP